MGFCAAHWRGLEPEEVQRQSCGSRWLGHLLRSRRAFCLLLAGHSPLGVIPGGPFGVNQSPPWVNSQVCSTHRQLLRGFYPDLRSRRLPLVDRLPIPGVRSSGPLRRVIRPILLPCYLTAAAIIEGAPLFSFGIYNRANKLPYTLNQTLDIQWQPRNDLAIEIGYVGNLGRHEVVPIPFNQAGIASPTKPHPRADLHVWLPTR